jgi:Fe-S-cluster-containing dehydrogenase component
MKSLSFVFDGQLCSGCLACVVACLDQNDLKTGDTALRRVLRLERGGYPASVSHLSIACLHCDDAPCLESCPAGAIFRRAGHGAVDVRCEQCVGCRTCASVCPVGAPRFAEDGRMIKCDLCAARIEHGLDPACVHTCTTGALQVGALDEPARTRHRQESIRLLRASALPAG